MTQSSEAAPLRMVVVGGVAGGASAAARTRRLAENASIVVLERGPHASFANCGLPYYVGGEIVDRKKLLVAGATQLAGWLHLDVRTRSEVLSIDRAARSVRVRRLDNGTEYDEPYDILLLSPGAAPIRPPALLEKVGADHPRVLSLRSIPDADRIKNAIDEGVKSAVVIGGGFIGLEIVEQLVRRNVRTSVVEALPQVMPPLDPEMVAPIHEMLRRHGVHLRLEDGVADIIPLANGRVEVALKSGAHLPTDLAVLAIGVRPESALAKAAGLELNERGAIRVNAHMQTSDPAIYAVGDAVEVDEPILGGRTQIALGGPANRQGRLAADHLVASVIEHHPDAERFSFRGCQGTSIVRVFERAVGMTGLSEKALIRAGKKRHVDYEVVYVHPNSHAGYYPGAYPLTLKLVFERPSGRVLGAQAVGADGIDKRLDVIAMAIQMRATVFDLEQAELCYAPPFGSAKDPVNMAGFQAANVLRGITTPITPPELAETLQNDPNSCLVLDVRTTTEFAEGAVPGAVNVPLDQLRAHLDEAPIDRPIVTYCRVGMRGYIAERILRGHGRTRVRNLTGGFTTWRQFFPAPPENNSGEKSGIRYVAKSPASTSGPAAEKK